MPINQFKIRKLLKNGIVNSFDCGDADLNEFILKEAVHYHKALLAVSYIVVDVKNEETIQLKDYTLVLNY